MTIFQKVRAKVKEWLGGGSSRKATPPRARAIRSVSRGNNQSTGYYRGGRYTASDEEERKRKQREKTANAFKAKKQETKNMSESLNRGKTSAEAGAKRAEQKSVIERKAQIDADREKARRRLDSLKTTMPKHNEKKSGAKTGGYTSEERKQVRRDVVKYNPKAAGAIGGVASALSWGATDLLGSVNEGNKYYKQHRDETAEAIAEGVTSLATFGGAGKAATKTVVKKLATESGEKAVAKVAGSKLIRKSAEKAVNKAVKRGTIKKGSEALAKEIAKDKAKRLISNVAENAVVDTTVGAAYDFNKATARHKIGSKEWEKEMLTNGLFNVGAAGIGVGLGNLKRNKTLIKEALDALPAKEVEKVIKGNNLSKNYLRGKLKDNALRVKRGSKWRAKDRVFKNAGRAEEALNRQAVLGDAYGDISKGILPKNEIDTGRLPRKVAPIRNIDNAERIEPHTVTASRVVDNAKEKASPNVRVKLGDLVKVSNKAETRIKEINDELKRVSDDISKARGTDSAREEELIQRFDDLMAERNSLEYSQRSANATKSVAEEPPKRKPTKTEKARDELRKERQALQEEYEAAKAAGEDTSGILADMQEADMTLKDLERKIAKADKARATKAAKGTKEAAAKLKPKSVVNSTDNVANTATQKAVKDADNVVDTTTQSVVKDADDVMPKAATVADNTKTSSEPTLKEQASKAERKARQTFDNERVEQVKGGKRIEREYRNYDAELREATNGKQGVRKGVVSVGKGSNTQEQKRILANMEREVDDFINGNMERADASEVLYNTWNAPRKAKAMEKSYAKASEGVNDIADNLKDKLERFIKDPDNGTDLKIDDVMDMIAVKQVYKDNGVAIPADLQETFNRLILANKTEHAQGLSVIEQILREYDPDYRRAYIRKDFDKYLSRFGNVDSWDEVAAALDRKYGKENYLQDKLQELVDFDGTTEEYKALYSKLQKEILRNSKPTLWNMLDALRHSFMLSNLATGKRNIFGNVSQRLMYDVADKINEGFEAAIERRIKSNPEFAKKYGEGFERTTTSLKRKSDNYKLAHEFTHGAVGEKLSKKKGYLDGANDSEYMDTLRKIVDEDIDEVMGYEKLMPQLEKGMDYVPEGVAESIMTTAYKGAQKAGKVVSFMLNEPDSWFVERNYRTALAKYLEVNGITDMASLKGKDELLARARQHAKDVALENTYKKANRLTTLIERGRAAGKKKGSSVFAKLGAITLDAELPYVKVPVNMFINNVKYSPIGVAENSWKAYRAICNGDIQGLQKAVAELSKGVTGTGLAALGFMLHCDENEQMDDDSWGIIANANKALKEYGVRDNSIKIGDFNFNIADIGLGATQMLMGTAYADAINENGGAPKSLLDTPEAILEAFGTTFDVIGDMSLLDNASQFIDAFSSGGDSETKMSERFANAATQVAPNYANQFIANPLRAVAKATTEADLDTGVKSGEGTTKLGRTLKRNANNIIQGVPYANEKVLPHKVDTHGNLISTGLFPEGRDTAKKKAIQALVNYTDAFGTRRIHIPEADKEELKVIKENGEPFKPNGFDKNRKYEAKVGKGKYAEYVDLTGKEREQVARAAKQSGYDLTDALVRKGMFGDRLGDRAQNILANAPDDEEKAREAIFATPEWKNADNETKEKWLEIMYGQGTKGDGSRGVSRARNREAYVEIQGNSEGDFRYQNDLDWHYQKKYEENGYAELGIDKGTYADVVQTVYDYSHKWDEEKGNVDTPNSAKKVKAALLSIEGLTTEQRIALYQGYRGKRNGFGWYDWDGVSGGSGYRRRGYRRYHRRGGGKSKIPAIKQSDFKAAKQTYKDAAEALPKASSSRRSASFNTSSVKSRVASSYSPRKTSTSSTVKIEPPKVKFKKYEV